MTVTSRAQEYTALNIQSLIRKVYERDRPLDVSQLTAAVLAEIPVEEQGGWQRNANLNALANRANAWVDVLDSDQRTTHD